jgi:hypothetical protein
VAAPVEKLDVVVATAGAVILVVAIVGATLSGGGRSAFDVTVTPASADLQGGSKPHQAEQGPIRDSFTITVNGSNVTRLTVVVTSTYAAGPSGAGTMHATLTSPTSTKLDQDGKATPINVGSTTGTVTATFDVVLVQPPENQTVQASSAADAVAKVERAQPTNATANLGDWKLDVSFSLGSTPAPVPSVTNGWTGKLLSYRLSAAPAAPASR